VPDVPLVPVVPAVPVLEVDPASTFAAASTNTSGVARRSAARTAVLKAGLGDRGEEGVD